MRPYRDAAVHKMRQSPRHDYRLSALNCTRHEWRLGRDWHGGRLWHQAAASPKSFNHKTWLRFQGRACPVSQPELNGNCWLQNQHGLSVLRGYGLLTSP